MGDDDIARLITLDPAHFHAALIHKHMLPGVSPRVSIYSPPGADLVAHLRLIEQFNRRPDNPTHWQLDVHCTPDSREEMIAERPGNVVVLAGRNRSKIAKIIAALGAALHVLADKPWIIRAEDFAALQLALSVAAQKGLVAYDMMTERHEITTILQRELVNDPNIFGTIIPADVEHPGVLIESTHHILKQVNGVPHLRPAHFFDVLDQGEGLTDVGTHLVDLVQWTLFPEQALDYRRDIQVQNGKRWAVPVRLEQFRNITGAAAFPAELALHVHGDQLDYYGNNEVDYTIRGAQVRVKVVWNWESAAGVDFHHALYRGTLASVEVRQTAQENFRPELYVAPQRAERHGTVVAAVRSRIERLQGNYPGIACETTGKELHIAIPERYRRDHEAHFSELIAQFLTYLRSPQSIPGWERQNMLSKYFTTTTGVQVTNALRSGKS